MACPQAVPAEEVGPTLRHPCRTLRPFQGPTASTLSLSPQTVLALKPQHTNVGRVGAMTIQTMMMRNLTLDPRLLEVATLLPAIRKKILSSIRSSLNNPYLGAVKLFASSASSRNNDDATSSEKVMHVSRKRFLRQTRRPAKFISLIEVCFSSPTLSSSFIDRFLQ
jgi:hypothetical protein